LTSFKVPVHHEILRAGLDREETQDEEEKAVDWRDDARAITDGED
jgi:hypothetical protein